MGSLIQTAMIIDDDADLTGLLSSILETRKIHVLVVHSLPEAEQYLTYLKPTIIFLDNSFPEGLGINFINTIKSADDEIKIIMMTGDSSKWVEEKALKEGINYFIKKPFSHEIIDSALKTVGLKHR